MIFHELQTKVSMPNTVSQMSPIPINQISDDSTGSGNAIRTLVELHATKATN